MQLQIGPHLEEALLEQYSMGNLPEEQTAIFEEHLLACEACQDCLLEMDTYINAVRTVSPRLREEPGVKIGVKREKDAHSAKDWMRELWAMLTGAKIPVMAGCAVAAAMVMLLRAPVAVSPAPEPIAVVLEARRGVDGVSEAKAPAARPLILQVDLTELPSLSDYRLEVVDRNGKGAWQASVKPAGNRIERALDTQLAQGVYFVRLYAPAGELLREFSLRIE